MPASSLSRLLQPCVLLMTVCTVLSLLCACGDHPAPGPRRLSPWAYNRLEGERFQHAYATRPGVVVTSSGLEYRVIKAGQGSPPQPTDTVRFHYRATDIAGKEFESSRDHGDIPVSMALDRLPLRGWREGLALMSAGAVYEFVIPSQLAYGLNGRPPLIGHNQTLIYTIELLSIDR